MTNQERPQNPERHVSTSHASKLERLLRFLLAPGYSMAEVIAKRNENNQFPNTKETFLGLWECGTALLVPLFIAMTTEDGSISGADFLSLLILLGPRNIATLLLVISEE